MTRPPMTNLGFIVAGAASPDQAVGGLFSMVPGSAPRSTVPDRALRSTVPGSALRSTVRPHAPSWPGMTNLGFIVAGAASPDQAVGGLFSMVPGSAPRSTVPDRGAEPGTQIG